METNPTVIIRKIGEEFLVEYKGIINNKFTFRTIDQTPTLEYYLEVIQENIDQFSIHPIGHKFKMLIKLFMDPI